MSNSLGSFIWYELMTTNADAAALFYGDVVGWQIGGPADARPDGKDYRMICRSDGGLGGGVLTLEADMLSHGARPTWLGYLYVSDVDATTRAIAADGGKILMPPTDLPVGRIAMVTDPMGSPLYVMTPIRPPDKPHARSDVFDTVAEQRVNWNELRSPDLVRAKSFYAKHFHFEFKETMDMGSMGDYCFIAHGGLSRIGAVMQAPIDGPACSWLFYFSVPSIAAATRTIGSSGGRILNGHHQVPDDRWIVIATDPQGAAFGLVGPQGT